MKHYLFILLILVSSLWAVNPNGSTVFVELNSGIKQKAQYLGTVGDTIILGGYIQNTYTKIKLPKSSFKSILDSTGQSLFSSIQDSVSKDSVLPIKEVEKPAPISLKNKTIILPFIRRGIDSLLAERLLHLTSEILSEQKKSIEIIKPTFFPDCKEKNCIQKASQDLEANALWTGEITPAKSQDSLNLKIERTLFSPKKTNQLSITISAKTPLQDVLKNKKWLSFIQNKAIEKKIIKSYVHVETDPEGAFVHRQGQNIICKTPCTFPTLDTGKILIETYWHVNQHLWGNQEHIQLIPEDTVKVTLNLKRIQPEIEIMTQPLGALIFNGNDSLSIKKRPLGTTPERIKVFEPGPAKIRLWKEGYKDTIINFYVHSIKKTQLSIDLTPLKDIQAIEQQQKWIKAKKKRNIGLTLTGSALAPIITGAIFTYLSHKNYKDAKEIKDQLKQPSVADGDHFQQLVDKNKDLVDKGDRKLYIGASLFGVGALMVGLGLTILF